MSALKDIIVLDFSKGKSGAVSSMFLADNGARVIRVSDNSQDDILKISKDEEFYETEFSFFNRGKELLKINISEEYKFIESLLASADVVIDDCGPSNDLYGLNISEITKKFPHIIHCSITPYGNKGPLKDNVGIPNLVKARSGMYDRLPGFRSGSIYVVHPVAEVGAGLLSSIGITSALFKREQTKHGCRVHTSLYAAALFYTPAVLSKRVKNYPNNSPVGGAPFYSAFECSDNNWIQLACIHEGFIDIAAAVMEIAHILLEERFGNGLSPVSKEAKLELFNIVKGKMKTKPSTEWSEIFNSADIPFALVQTSKSAIHNEQLIHNNMIIEIEDPILGLVKQPGIPLDLSDSPGMVNPFRYVTKEELLISFPFNRIVYEPVKLNTVDEMPLLGVKVTDITNVIAGPAAGRLLADLGASVVKVEPHYGDLSRSINLPFFHALNSNKKGISINAKDDRGNYVVRTIISQSDVLIANLRPGVLDRLGLSSEELRKLNPKIIDSHISAFGTSGPFAHRPGLDPLAQAWLGLQTAQGGSPQRPSFIAQLAPTDYTAGLIATLGVTISLYHREKTGKGQTAETNLLNAGTLLLEGDLTETTKIKTAKSTFTNRRLADINQYGLSDFNRLYETSDGWIYVSSEGDTEKFCQFINIYTDGIKNNDHLDIWNKYYSHTDYGVEISNVFKNNTTEFWMNKLTEVGINVSESIENYDVSYFNDEHPILNNMIATHTTKGKNTHKYITGFIKFDELSTPHLLPTPLLGEHSREILKEFGFDDMFIDSIIGDNVLIIPDSKI